jgi:hypothetical protein
VGFVSGSDDFALSDLTSSGITGATAFLTTGDEGSFLAIMRGAVVPSVSKVVEAPREFRCDAAASTSMLVRADVSVATLMRRMSAVTDPESSGLGRMGVRVLDSGFFGLSVSLVNCIAVGLGLGGIVDTLGTAFTVGIFTDFGAETPSNPAPMSLAGCAGLAIGFVGEGGIAMDDVDPIFAV